MAMGVRLVVVAAGPAGLGLGATAAPGQVGAVGEVQVLHTSGRRALAISWDREEQRRRQVHRLVPGAL